MKEYGNLHKENEMRKNKADRKENQVS